jgi:CRISPR-associated protein Csb2
MLSIQWEYLLDRLVASDASDRDLPEWPPHPDRVFQALVASWGETDMDDACRQALEWLAALPPPELAVPPTDPANLRPPGTCFVPVNDVPYTTGKSNPLLRDLEIGRNRQGRSFPRFPVPAPCHLLWPTAPPAQVAQHLPALRQLCLATASIGHSSSLVRLWADQLTERPAGLIRHIPGEGAGATMMRVPSPGRMAQLVEAFADGGPDWERPPAARWLAYSIAEDDSAGAPCQGVFSPRLHVLRAVGPNARRYGAAHAPALAAALRGAMMAAAIDGSRAMELISGHRNGSTEPIEGAHCAFIPLPFVGAPHADGHLLGMALVLPNGLSPTEQLECEAALARCLDDENRMVLRLPKGGHLDLESVAPGETRQTLQPATWAPPAGARRWASATPMVLDRMPPRRVRDREAFMAETIATACERVGLPAPCHVELGEVSQLEGAPHASAFPAMPRKDGTRRWHLHACIEWAVPIRGPVLLGAGRYRGLGLFRPLPDPLRRRPSA